MKIICVDRGDNVHITKGKTYTTDNLPGVSHYRIIADDGMIHSYQAERFAVVNEEAPPNYPTKVVEPGGGMKFDGGKPSWVLLMHGCRDGLVGVVAVLGMGAKKYAADSWQKLENAEKRYTDALYRHLDEIAAHGLLHKDAESGLLSIFHVCTDALFLACFAAKRAKAQAEKDTH